MQGQVNIFNILFHYNPQILGGIEVRWISRPTAKTIILEKNQVFPLYVLL